MTNKLRTRTSKLIPSAIFFVFAFLSVSCSPSSFPERLPLEGNWYFQYDSEQSGIENGWHEEYRPGSGWETVPLGAYWSDDYDGAGWYQHQIWLPALRTDRNLALVITAVSDSATLWLNGERLELSSTEDNLQYADIRNHILSEGDNLFVIQVIDSGGPGGLNGDVYIQKYVEAEELDGIGRQRDIAGL